MWSNKPSPGHMSRNTIIQKDDMNLSVDCSTINNSQDMETTKRSVPWGMDTEDVVRWNIT